MDALTGLDGNDTTFNGGVVVRKPNIYIYPAEEIEMDVELHFPKGGEILESNPKYVNNWHIQVEPSGFINTEYRYLFYEARIPNILQREFAWIVKGKELDDFFRKNLADLTFSVMEIKDFLDYWLPYFSSEKTYVIYPHFTKELSDVIEINFSLPPENLNRIIYWIEEYTGNVTVKRPEIPDYKRDGFTVLEWGVIYN
ncbi:MAG: hypothetical protein JXL67_14340 [Calditrichaeota bacterium]|nr:hypothetical protein [Calditrichota bacterium]